MNRAKEMILQNKAILLILFLVIFYTVGTIGLLLPQYREQFLSLSFLNLTLSFLVVLLARTKDRQKFYLFLFLSFMVGMTVEWIGTKTGLLFGNYSYGANLGPKISGVPLVIGFNWGILVVTSASVIEKIKGTVLTKSVLAAGLMTLLDVLMEPVAIKSDYWTWVGEIPLYNYVCWFVISLPLHYLYFKSKLVEANKVYTTLFWILTVFFIILNLF
jgi:bisanhydrobacterioruberin hydratase